jgi:hypothetical protein
MIKFALACAGGHEFESWFQNGAAFDKQDEAGLILCPVCRTTKVTKAVMAPAIASHGREAIVPATQQPHGEGPANAVLLDDRDRELRAAIADMRARIFAHTDDVGARFSEEARKIHDGLAPERAIHGLASPEEAHALIEEGVGILPIPPLPGDYN